ncbi:MAG: hypothetical protein P8163_08205 [Candidatus Thiodiazotropha sp.]
MTIFQFGTVRRSNNSHLLGKRIWPTFRCHVNQILGLSLILIPITAVSLSDFSLQMEKLDSPEWSVKGLLLSLTQTSQQLSFKSTLSKFDHQALAGSVKGIEFRCAELQWHQQSYLCKQGILSIAESPFGAQQAQVTFNYIDSTQFEIELSGLDIAAGGLKLALKMTQSGWQLKIVGERLNVDQFNALMPAKLIPQDWEVGTVLSLQAGLSGVASTLQQVDLTADIKQLNYADEEGLQVAEGGSGELQFEATRTESGWFGSARLELDQGQFYSDPYYLDLTQSPLNLSLKGGWSAKTNQLQLQQAELQLLPVVEARGRAQIDLNTFEIQSAAISYETAQLGELYQTIIQPKVIGSMADELQIAGGLSGEIALSPAGLESFRTQFKSINVDDNRELFALHDLDGLLAWSKQGTDEVSHIEVQSGHLYQIPHGPLSVQLQTLANGMRLLKPLDISLLGGQIIVDRFETKNLFHGSPEWETGAELNNLSLQQLSSAFDWPALSGKLNGKLPKMHYQDDLLNFDGALKVDVFDGEIEVKHLKIKQPLGRVPELFAAVEMQGMDLEKITRTFSFGHIEGGLEGWINGLHLLNWEPVAFQAQFNSPEDDLLPHRISQRAVDNLTSIGNGMGGSLQNTFLGIFKEFRYNRIQLQATLDGDIAELGGLDHPDGGYYLVKGAGLPRIDVIARNRRVAWKTLVERLKNIRVEGMKVR